MFKRYLVGFLTAAILLGLLTFSAAAQSNTRILDTGIAPIDDTTSLSLTASAVTSVETTVKPAATEAASATYSTLTFGSSGPEVVDLQSRLQDLGYYSYKVTGYYGEVTCYAVKLFQKYNKIADTGTVGELTNAKLYLNDAVRMPMDAIDENANRLGLTPTVKPTATKKPSSGGSTSHSSGKYKTGAYYDWWKKVQYMFPRGMTVTVTDYYTGVSWKMKRTGGKNHADCEPVSSADTAKYKSVYGRWSWARRPVVVNINGTLVAASINGMPHGYDTISSNNMTGQVCIHFLNSRTHCTNAKDPQHQKCVKIAAGRA